MGRPARLCKLAKGQLIDSQAGFVETFNWMVDYINNLCGDNKRIEITNPTGSNPVVRFKGGTGGPGGGGAGITVNVGGTDYAGVETLTFQTADDSAVTFAATQDGTALTLEIGVHWV